MKAKSIIAKKPSAYVSRSVRGAGSILSRVLSSCWPEPMRARQATNCRHRRSYNYFEAMAYGVGIAGSTICECYITRMKCRREAFIGVSEGNIINETRLSSVSTTQRDIEFRATCSGIQREQRYRRSMSKISNNKINLIKSIS